MRGRLPSRPRACWHSGPPYARPIADDDPFASRERRARAAIVGMLPSLAAVHAAHDDPSWTHRRARHRRAALDRRTDVRPRSRGRPRAAPARRSSRPLRRVRRRRDRRRRRSGLARASAAQHFLPARAAQVAGLAVGEGSACRRRRALSRPADLGVAPHPGLHLHARRGCDRLALDAARRDSARPALDRGARAVRGRARVHRRGAVAGTGHVRSVSGRIARLGRDCGPRGRRRTRPNFTARCAT